MDGEVRSLWQMSAVFQNLSAVHRLLTRHFFVTAALLLGHLSSVPEQPGAAPQIIFKARISRQLTTTNLSTVGMSDCCLDNSSPSGHVTAQTVVPAKQAAAWLQHRSTGRVAGTPRCPHVGFCSFQSSCIFHFVPHFAPPFPVHTKKAQR